MKRYKSESGHMMMLLITLLAGIGLIILASAVAQANPILAWIGGIGAALLFIVQFGMVHAEFGKIYARIEQLEKKQDQE